MKKPETSEDMSNDGREPSICIDYDEIGDIKPVPFAEALRFAEAKRAKEHQTELTPQQHRDAIMTMIEELCSQIAPLGTDWFHKGDVERRHGAIFTRLSNALRISPDDKSED